MSLKRDCWENLMVLGVNELLAQGCIKLDDTDEHGEGYARARFTHPDGTPCEAIASCDSGGEVSVLAIYDPKPDAAPSVPLGPWHGRVAVSGWLERRKGRHIQTIPKLCSFFFYGQRDAFRALAAHRIEAQGFERSGRLYL